MGRDSASSAQSNRAEGGGTARLGLDWGELGSMGDEQGVGGEQGVFAGTDGVVGDAGEVCHMLDGEMARLRGFRGEQGSWDASGGCSDMPGGVLVRSWAVACVPERGRAGG
jgi:hypothetical protein